MRLSDIKPLKSEILFEGINDKGIFKCLFLGGLPAAGKSTFIERLIKRCDILPKVLDFDTFYEYLSNKHDVDISVEKSKDGEAKALRQDARNLTKASLNLYMQGMLPLIVDTTAISQIDLGQRMMILQQHGYDLAMVYLQEDLDVKLERAKNRKRGVDPQIIIDNHKHESKRINELFEYMTRHDYMFHLSNPKSRDYDHIFIELANDFFHAPVKNEVGLNKIRMLKDAKLKYAEVSKSDIDFWYHA
jgi:predicted kinase